MFSLIQLPMFVVNTSTKVLSQTPKLVFGVIASNLNGNGQYITTNVKLAEAVGLSSTRSVVRSVRQLKKLGLIRESDDHQKVPFTNHVATVGKIYSLGSRFDSQKGMGIL